MPLVDLASAIRGFFQQHLISERGLSGNTVLSYRDAMKFFLAFACRFHRKSCTNLTLNDLSDDAVRRFLRHLAEDRHNSVKTRNDRLCAIHSFFQYLSIIDPSAIKQCQAILAVRHKSCPHRIPKFLEREEVQQVFRQLDLKIPLRLRDDALLRVLYNSGMRAQELVDLDVNHLRFTRPFSVLIHGKDLVSYCTSCVRGTIMGISTLSALPSADLRRDVIRRSLIEKSSSAAVMNTGQQADLMPIAHGVARAVEHGRHFAGRHPALIT
jgi:site-specific recombinase XerC